MKILGSKFNTYQEDELFVHQRANVNIPYYYEAGFSLKHFACRQLDFRERN